MNDVIPMIILGSTISIFISAKLSPTANASILVAIASMKTSLKLNVSTTSSSEFDIYLLAKLNFY